MADVRCRPFSAACKRRRGGRAESATHTGRASRTASGAPDVYRLGPRERGGRPAPGLQASARAGAQSSGLGVQHLAAEAVGKSSARVSQLTFPRLRVISPVNADSSDEWSNCATETGLTREHHVFDPHHEAYAEASGPLAAR